MSDIAATLDAIRAIVGPKGFTDDSTVLAPYLEETRGLFHGTCLGLVRPASTDETARVVFLCAQAGIPITPQGGNTGHVGGAVPDGGILLNMERMRAVRSLDTVNRTITVEAGCVLADLQRKAADAGFLFPLSMGSEGSCQIGGNLATNAGGVHVLRYGNARDLVLGLEVVLPDGRVWNGLKGLRKDNAGYALKDLFVGAEGTLGVITAATLKLFPAPRRCETALAAIDDIEAAVVLFSRIEDTAGPDLAAFEFMPRIALDFVLRHIPDTADPFTEPHPAYVLMELASPTADETLRETLETMLGEAFEAGLLRDAVIAGGVAQHQALWRIRESIPEAQKHEGGSIKHDISVAVSRWPQLLDRATALAEELIPGVRVCAFGHVGDGNLHFNLSQPVGADSHAFLARWPEINARVNELVAELEGSIAAEHGVGQLKREQLLSVKSEVELDLMRALKRAFDPQNLMNPGKIVDPEHGNER